MFVVDELIGVVGCMFCDTFFGAAGDVGVATIGCCGAIGVVGALFLVFALCAFAPVVVFLCLPVVFVFFAGEGFAPFAG